MIFLDINTSRFESIAQLVTVAVIFVFVLLITYWTTRWVGNYQKNQLLGSNIKVMETLRISNTKYLQIIKAGEKYFVIAVCKETITYLCELNGEELDFSAMEKNSEIHFKDILDKIKEKNIKKK